MVQIDKRKSADGTLHVTIAGKIDERFDAPHRCCTTPSGKVVIAPRRRCAPSRRSACARSRCFVHALPADVVLVHVSPAIAIAADDDPEPVRHAHHRRVGEAAVHLPRLRRREDPLGPVPRSAPTSSTRPSARAARSWSSTACPSNTCRCDSVGACFTTRRPPSSSSTRIVRGSSPPSGTTSACASSASPSRSPATPGAVDPARASTPRRCAPPALSPDDARKIERNAADDVLAARRFPTIEFRSTRVTRDGERARIDGTLTLHGAHAPAAVRRRRRRRSAGSAEVRLDVRDFGIKPYSALFGTLRVRADVRVRSACRAHDAAPPRRASPLAVIALVGGSIAFERIGAHAIVDAPNQGRAIAVGGDGRRRALRRRRAAQGHARRRASSSPSCRRAPPSSSCTASAIARRACATGPSTCPKRATARCSSTRAATATRPATGSPTACRSRAIYRSSSTRSPSMARSASWASATAAPPPSSGPRASHACAPRSPWRRSPRLRDIVPVYTPRTVPLIGWLVPHFLQMRTVDVAGRMGGFDPDAASPRAAARATKTPILLIHGRDDTTVPLRQSQLIAAGSPTVTLASSTPRTTTASRAYPRLWPLALDFFARVFK